MEEVVVLIVQVSNVTTAKKYKHFPKDCYYQKKVDDTKDDGILLMAYEGNALDVDMVWYMDTNASNNMCGHKYLFVDIQDETHENTRKE